MAGWANLCREFEILGQMAVVGGDCAANVLIGLDRTSGPHRSLSKSRVGALQLSNFGHSLGSQRFSV